MSKIDLIRQLSDNELREIIKDNLSHNIIHLNSISEDLRNIYCAELDQLMLSEAYYKYLSIYNIHNDIIISKEYR